MSVISFPRDIRDEAVSLLMELVEDLTEELGGRPTLGEFLEVFGWAVPTGSSALADTVVLPRRFKATLRKSGRYKPAKDSRVRELNDAPFAEATEFLAFLAEHTRATLGRPVTVAELTAALASVLTAAPIAFDDVGEGELLGLGLVRPAEGVPKPKVGDIVAIPAKSGGYHMAVIVGRDRFGTALGFFQGFFLVPRVGSDGRPAVRPYPMYTDEQLFAKGVWKVVGHDESLRALFPPEPEIYHRADRFPPGTVERQYGAAETAKGRLRAIDRAEAEAVGLLNGTYDQVHLSGYLQKRLDDGTL